MYLQSLLRILTEINKKALTCQTGRHLSTQLIGCSAERHLRRGRSVIEATCQVILSPHQRLGEESHSQLLSLQCLTTFTRVVFTIPEVNNRRENALRTITALSIQLNVFYKATNNNINHLYGNNNSLCQYCISPSWWDIALDFPIWFWSVCDLSANNLQCW